MIGIKKSFYGQNSERIIGNNKQAVIDWESIALKRGKFYEDLYSWSATQIIKQDSIIVYERNRLFAFTLALQEKKIFEFPEMDISEEYHTYRQMQVLVAPGEHYLVICNEGDRWQFEACFGANGTKAVIIMMTTALSATETGAFDYKEHQFEKQILINHKIHLISKPNKYYVVRSIPEGKLNGPVEVATRCVLQHRTLERKIIPVSTSTNVRIRNTPKQLAIKSMVSVPSSDIIPIADIVLTPASNLMCFVSK